jgi:hypothetical protein
MHILAYVASGVLGVIGSLLGVVPIMLIGVLGMVAIMLASRRSEA